MGQQCNIPGPKPGHKCFQLETELARQAANQAELAYELGCSVKDSHMCNSAAGMTYMHLRARLTAGTLYSVLRSTTQETALHMHELQRDKCEHTWIGQHLSARHCCVSFVTGRRLLATSTTDVLNTPEAQRRCTPHFSRSSTTLLYCQAHNTLIMLSQAHLSE